MNTIVAVMPHGGFGDLRVEVCGDTREQLLHAAQMACPLNLGLDRIEGPGRTSIYNRRSGWLVNQAQLTALRAQVAPQDRR